MLKNIFVNHATIYPSPKYLNNNWSFGSTLGLLMGLQVVVGTILAMFYRPSGETAFNDIVYIVNDVNGGYILKYMHLNLASFIFLIMYLHMFRGIYYGSFLRLPGVWYSGMILFVLSIITAFLGYVLPWGQMSFWAATVITNLVTSIPFIGNKLIIFIHGGFSVNSLTLNRFFVLHFFFAIIILAVIFVHIALLHRAGSSNPSLKLKGGLDKVSFYYYFFYKDLQFFLVVLLGLFVMVFLYPNALNHPDNFNEANPMVTPTHIVPEWYFLPFYAILRSIPNKLFGVLAMALSLIFLFALPLLSSFKSREFSLVEEAAEPFFYIFVYSFIMLGYLGSMPAEQPYVLSSQIMVLVYFLSFVFLSLAGRVLRYAEKIRRPRF
jgi:ubiquinol-cytochrome c reductase cytochrome b subunit